MANKMKRSPTLIGERSLIYMSFYLFKNRGGVPFLEAPQKMAMVL
ncbi:hypothetical protein [Fischerella sp.]|nr:hypothetical protein [Fischerella sp.]